MLSDMFTFPLTISERPQSPHIGSILLKSHNIIHKIYHFDISMQTVNKMIIVFNTDLKFKYCPLDHRAATFGNNCSLNELSLCLFKKNKYD